MLVQKNSSPSVRSLPPRGRAASTSPSPRYLAWSRDSDPAAARDSTATKLIPETPRSLINANTSPDVPYSRAVNPYRGCEHGCIYCYARPGHAYADLSPGLDFETRIFCKTDAAAVLRRELARPGYRAEPLALGSATDAWQPAERHTGLTRSILEVLLEHRHPLTILTRSALIERDIDLLAALAREDLVQVSLSITTLDATLARKLEPRAPLPQRRLQALAALHAAGIPVGVMLAPVIPALNDHEIEHILSAAAAAGASTAGYTLLRLPDELDALFRDWLCSHYPGRAAHVLSLLRQCRNGRHNDPRFGFRMRGEGPLAALYAQRFTRALRQHDLQPAGAPALRCDLFRVPGRPRQASLF